MHFILYYFQVHIIFTLSEMFFLHTEMWNLAIKFWEIYFQLCESEYYYSMFVLIILLFSFMCVKPLFYNFNNVRIPSLMIKRKIRVFDEHNYRKLLKKYISFNFSFRSMEFHKMLCYLYYAFIFWCIFFSKKLVMNLMIRLFIKKNFWGSFSSI